MLRLCAVFIGERGVCQSFISSMSGRPQAGSYSSKYLVRARLRATCNIQPKIFRIALSIVLLLMLSNCAIWEGAKLIAEGDNIDLRETADDIEEVEANPELDDHPDILLIALDGVDRDLLYQMLSDGELPEMAALLGSDIGSRDFSHAHFDKRLLSTLPSSTSISWATMITGVQAGEHGIVGNEWFERDTGNFFAPTPVTVEQLTPILKIYTEAYANDLLHAPTVYEQMRAVEPAVTIVVAMHHFFEGADELIIADRTALAEAFTTVIGDALGSLLNDDQSLGLFGEVDEEVLENVTEIINANKIPDVLTIYLPGVDHFAHIAEAGPDVARQRYLREEIDPRLKPLREAMQDAGALDNRYIVISSDHGHTQVLSDDEHSLSIKGEGEPPTLLEAGGYTVRPFSIDVSDDAYFDTVLAYQGALAYVYVANRSTCTPEAGCNWSLQARQEDINELAELFFNNNESGELVSEMQGVLDMVLIRNAVTSTPESQRFEVYLGQDKTVSLTDYLAANPHDDYVELVTRLNHLTAGPYARNVGDVILIANNGNKHTPEERYYFSEAYYSWHGSPSKQDAEVPFIIAHPQKSRSELAASADAALVEDHSVAGVSRLLMQLRYPEKSE